MLRGAKERGRYLRALRGNYGIDGRTLEILPLTMPFDGVFRYDFLWRALGLNVPYLTSASSFS